MEIGCTSDQLREGATSPREDDRCPISIELEGSENKQGTIISCYSVHRKQ